MAEWKIGPMILVPDAFEIRTHSGPSSPIQQKLLYALIYLIENRERVVTRDELLRAVWGHSRVSETSLDRVIYNIRKLLGDTKISSGFIRTVHGIGYQFVGPCERILHTS